MNDLNPRLGEAFDKIQYEPNFFVFVYKDYTCIVKRMMNAYSFFGNLNGYVVIPQAHKLHGKNYMDNELENINCHGGLTWSSLIEDIIDLEKSNLVLLKGSWMFGFDTAHAWDIRPFMVMRDMMMMPSYQNIINDSTYKDFEYVVSECKSIVDQLEKLTKK